MNRAIRAFILTGALIIVTGIVTGCGSEPKKPTQDVLMTEDGFGSIRDIQKAYASRNMSGIEKLCTKEAYASIAASMKEFSSVRLEMVPQLVRILEDQSMSVQVSWQGVWKIGSSIEKKDNGKAEFIFRGHPQKLAEIKGKSPFAAPHKGI